MKTFYDSREYAPGREAWKSFEARVIITTRSQYLLAVGYTERSKDFNNKYLVIPKDDFIVKDVFITESFLKALFKVLFTRHKVESNFPDDLL